MDKHYIEGQYHLAMLDFKLAINEDQQWEARRTMARLEALAIELFGIDFQKELREKEGIRENGEIVRDTPAPQDPGGGRPSAEDPAGDHQSAENPVKEAAEFVREYAAKVEKQTEADKNFLIEDNSVFPFEIREGSHAALRYAHIKKGDAFQNRQDVESGVEMSVIAAIYKDGTLNEYDQGIEERRFTLKGVDAINQFCSKLDRSVKNSIKAHPDMQPVVTINYSQYDQYNPLVGEHMRLSLDRANSLFELIDIVAEDEVKEKGSGVSYRTSADVMFVQSGEAGCFEISQDFGKMSGSILKQIERDQKEMLTYFKNHILLSSSERDLEYLGAAAAVMKDKIFEMRTFLNTGEIVPAPERNKEVQPQQIPAEKPAAEKEPSPASLTPPESSAVSENRVYLELPYVKKEQFPALIQELKQKGAKFDREQKQWYVDQKSADSGMFNAYIRTYLILPSMGKEEFASAIEHLKQNGAHFDKLQKKWYIDADCDKGKFQAYLDPKLRERASVIPKRAPRRYGLGADGQMHRTWNGKLPEEFSEQDALAFLADTDQKLKTLAAMEQASEGEERDSVLEALQKAKETTAGHEKRGEGQSKEARQHQRENVM